MLLEERSPVWQSEETENSSQKKFCILEVQEAWQEVTVSPNPVDLIESLSPVALTQSVTRKKHYSTDIRNVGVIED